jgi:CheY-like chemotaxis protein
MHTILVVEDEPAIVELLQMVLEDAGYRVITAANGQEALARLEELRADLVLSDVMMPVMDGRTLCRTMRAEVQYHDLPIVLMSAAAVPADSDTDATAFIRKPFHLHDLVGTLSAIIGTHSRSDAR